MALRPCLTAARCLSIAFARRSVPILRRPLTIATLTTPSRLITKNTGLDSSKTSPHDEEYVFDPTLSVQKDAAVNAARLSLDGIVRGLLPPNAPDAAITKVRAYLQQHPIDTLITYPQVQITHVEDPDTGIEVKMSLSPCDVSEAQQQAQERGMHLVQMGARGDVAYCRIRREAPRILSLVQTELEAMREEHEKERPGTTSQAEIKLRELVDHQFRDVVDAHFIGWKSKKIIEDLRKWHPVKLTIREFQSPDTALGKLREMCNAMQRCAEEKAVYHHFTSIVANEREASVTLSPSIPSNKSNSWKHIKYPGEKEWAHAKSRMESACRKGGRYGTYSKNNTLKPRSLGQTMFRVDKYGRKID